MSSHDSQGAELARLLVLQQQYEEILETIGDSATVVPIKGIALLKTIYAERWERRVNDIDLVIIPSDRLSEVARKLVDTGKYEFEFGYLEDDENVKAKQKICLQSKSYLLTNIDLHGGFFTKKYFRLSSPEFNDDAISRLTHVSDVEARMDAVDQWLFLAAHACFHMFGEEKWVKDLYLLQRGMTDEELGELDERIRKYGFDRVAWGAYTRMESGFGRENIRMRMPVIKDGDDFKRFIFRFHSKPRRGLGKALTKRYYEFIHIADSRKRRKVTGKLFFPAIPMLRSIYRFRSRSVSVLFYPVHVLICALSWGAFKAYYNVMAR